MKKFFKNLAFGVGWSLVLLQGCSKDEMATDEYAQEEMAKDLILEPMEALEETMVLKDIREWGYMDNNILDYGDFYVVEGDMIFHKDEDYSLDAIDLNAGKQNSSEGKGEEIELNIDGQWFTGNKVGNYLNRVVRIHRNPALENGWETAITNAVNAWNGACGIRLSAVTTLPANTDNLNVTVNHANLPLVGGVRTTVARADFPNNTGRPGTIMEIDPFFNTYSVAQKTTVMIHEIGHLIGFRHTDSRLGRRNEPTTGNNNYGTQYGYVHVAGTPTGADANSIMNHNIGGTTIGFSTHDRTGALSLYPRPIVLSMTPASLNLTQANNSNTSVSITGTGLVTLTLTGDSGILLQNGSTTGTTLSFTAPRTIIVYMPNPQSNTNRLTRINLNNSSGSTVAMTTVYHSGI